MLYVLINQIKGVTMLLKFSVTNYKSIGKKININFIASADETHQEQLLSSESFKGNILPVMSIYGSNAAGKSNILKALVTATKLIRNSMRIQDGELIPYYPFKFDLENIDSGTNVEFLFIHNDRRYFYGFTYNNQEILEEYLYHYPNERQTIIFERNRNEYNFTSDKSLLEPLSKLTLNNRLFLATATQLNIEQIKIPFSYLTNSFISNNIDNGNHNWLSYTFKKISSDIEFKKRVLNILNLVKSDIKDFDISFVEKKLSMQDIPDGLPLQIKEIFLNQNAELSKITTTHSCNNDERTTAQFDINEESAGTRKFLELIGPCIDIIEKGKCLIVDELETSLHPFIIKYLITLFLDPRININQAQLLFTTHDTNLLDLAIFRRDQIWLAEKDSNLCTDFYSLSDLNGVRKDENIAKGYLRGKYGAIPFLSIDHEGF